MDAGNEYIVKKSNPFKNASSFSQILFLYLFPIFYRTYKKEFSEDDLFEPLIEHKSGILGEKLEKIWKEENAKKSKYALHKSLLRIFGVRFILVGLVRLGAELLLTITIPLSIGKLVTFFGNGEPTVSVDEMYAYAGIFVISYIINAICAHASMQGTNHICMKMRVSCSSLMYRKALRLNKTSLSQTTVGQIVNLLSNDVNKFDQGFEVSHNVFISPIKAALGSYLLYREIGVSAFFGIGFLLTFVPFQIYAAKKASTLRLKTALRTDERVRLMNEILTGIQVIKMYCWEKPFAKLIAFARRKEMNAIRSRASLLGILLSFEIFATRTSVFISILGFIVLGNVVTAKIVFTVTAIYNILQIAVTSLFAFSIYATAEVNISLLRIQTFLSLYEKEDEPVTLSENKHDDDLKPRIFLHRVNAKFIKGATENILEDITINISSSKLLAVIGPVGSGKTTLLNLILGELLTTNGDMEIFGKISYCSQDPWLFEGSIRNNILFGEEYNEQRYNKIVGVCALKSDFHSLPYGDKTLVGERGKSLSGGQKARINLARCVYKQADIYLLDDPLSAVDANVGKHIYQECIKKLLSDRISILTTHQIQYLQNADSIIIFKNGLIEDEGTYEQLQRSGLDFANLLNEIQAEEEKDQKSRTQSESEDNVAAEIFEPVAGKESVKAGSVRIKSYYKYFRFGGGHLSIILVISSFVTGYIIAYGGDYFVRYWVNLEQTEVTGGRNGTFSRTNIIYTYAGITAGTILFALGQCVFFMLYFITVSINLHNRIFDVLIEATSRFFDDNPSGRILNRFSKDLGVIDEYIPNISFDVLSVILIVLGSLLLPIFVEPWLLIPSVCILIIFYIFRMVFIRTSRSVKRIEGITRSPIFTHLTTSVQGLTTIRASSMEKRLIEEFDHLQDRHSCTWYLFIASTRCFGFYIDLFCTLFIGIAMLVLMSLFSERIYGGDIGMIITQYLGLMVNLQWGMRQWSALENQMTSVERVLEYSEIETEPKRPHPGNKLDHWPTNGKIEFQNLKLRYRTLEPYVLKDISFTVKVKEKIGIVGRTGAGKSSLIGALFQLYDTEGRIMIDDVDATKLPLEIVRSKISIIPQEPVLFSGTLRRNLDPFEEYGDQQLWDALEQVELKKTITDSELGLCSFVSEGASNFSIGQRQLVCLARALLRNNKILVIDEATANVDPYTDALIQETIRRRFSQCTVLTIAHRLHTVMDSDRILVMSEGKIEEYDHPHLLLKNEHSLLYKLANDGGETTANYLKNIAYNNYKQKVEADVL